MKGIVIASGGMDSATLAYSLAAEDDDITLVGFDYGQRHSRELRAMLTIAIRLDAPADIIDLREMGARIGGSALTDTDVVVPDGHYAEESMRATVVPNRNAIMLSIATGMAVAAGADYVAIGVHAGDHFIYPDCRPKFIAALEMAFVYGNEGHAVRGFHLHAPFVAWSKRDIVHRGQLLGVPWADTWSCYKGGDRHCGTCGTCYERQEAFRDAGVADPTEYERPLELA